MADLSSEQLLGLARVARLSIPDQDETSSGDMR